ncbi:hypothetical protein HYDPIDRAFT_34894 [Hydnomerulius pinastri MD-312]|uniref:Unplaced genomic scaffold scaffold_356, whole genome shotgun sequence n=1 Tax=Hydnomerulius pinastri MD-312 TaxID=994086 RepID=A0A0C9VWS0_9AGAM|nr:hypothetical protein HYDPIDRAFT_34894 [Hydnomerulius pinastri MD-312]
MAGIRNVSRKAYLWIRGRLPQEPPLPAPTSPQPPEPSPLPLATYTGHSSWIYSIAFLPDSKHVVSTSDDGTIRKWSLAEGHDVGEVIKVGSAVLAVAASEDGKLLASGGVDGKVILWDAKSHEKVVEGKERHSNVVGSLSFSRDSARIASASHDKSVIVRSTSTGERLAAPFTGHTDRVWSITISRDGRFIVSGSIDNTVKLWDAATHQQISPPLRHDGWVRFVSISPDAKYVASGGDDKKVKLWSLRKLVEPSYTIERDDVATQDNEHPKSSDSGNGDEGTPQPSDRDKEAKDEGAKVADARKDETESVRNFLDVSLETLYHPDELAQL